MDRELFDSTPTRPPDPSEAGASERSAWVRVGVALACVIALLSTAIVAQSGPGPRSVAEHAPVPLVTDLPAVAARPGEPTAPSVALPVPAVDLPEANPLEAEIAAEPGIEAEIEPESEIEADEQADESLPPIDEYAVLTTPGGSADRVISPSLGDPAEMRIERSRQDREREDRAAARAAIAASLDAARRARSEGRLDDADTGYAQIALLAPDDGAVLIEWSGLLVELGRPDDALALVEGARSRAPRNQTLLIGHARLLEAKGDLAGAIALLEHSGLALTEAPDVHAVVAAYHQRAGDHAAAIERYEEILRRFPDESRGWMGLGISLEAVGRRNEARDVYRIALQVGELPGATRRWVSDRLALLGEGN